MRRIIVVDHDFAVGWVIRKMIIDARVKAIYCDHAQEALAKITEDPFIIAGVINYNLPDMNGIELLQMIYKVRPEMKAAILHDEDSDSLKDQALSIGAKEFLVKPVQFDVLQNLVQQLLERRKRKRTY